MIDKLYDINKQLDSLKGISYYCELREGHCNGCPLYELCKLNTKPSRWYK